MKKAIITGITGQVGSYLAERLLREGYKVIGVHRRTSLPNFERLEGFADNPNLTLQEFDITDPVSVNNLISTEQPDEVYNMAAQSHVHTSFDQPDYTFRVNTLGVNYFLEAIRRFSPKTRFITASTSEMFGFNYDVVNGRKMQNETTQLKPQSPYAIAKLAAHEMVRLYREAYGLHACTVIMFNNESPRRGEQFVTRKITKWIAKFQRWVDEANDAMEYQGDHSPFTFDEDYIKCDYTKDFPKLRLGNLDSMRDWGYTADYVRAINMIITHDTPDDFVVATGESHTIREFLDLAFKYIGIEDWSDYVVQDPRFFRPAEVDFLLGDSTKIRQTLGWEPRIHLEDLVRMMIDSDIANEQEKLRQPGLQKMEK